MTDLPTQAVIPMPGVTPNLVPSDANAAADLYVKALGGEIIARMPADDGKRLMHCMIMINGGPIILNDAFPEYGAPHVPPAGYVMHLQVEDGQMWWDRAVAAGFTVVMPYKLEFWGDYYGHLRDPYGIVWSIGSTPQKAG
ncbi:VOC family protein [Arsenicitalea aurantiaca]|uniref:VOC family protein n=1 Tax=Arsenicitalea aurantiaca TaxID=1783274 RepID=A0A433X434_9HYPH|nr:VOC family protein [Arsenicitalea aurantiaca]RUT28827.1 VOC family protein [Arsenicitalea aurantiaca]